MFLPQHHRVLAIVIYTYVAWQFLTLGAVVASAGILLSFEARPDAALLVPAGSIFLQIGVWVVDQLRHVMGGPGLRF